MKGRERLVRKSKEVSTRINKKIMENDTLGFTNDSADEERTLRARQKKDYKKMMEGGDEYKQACREYSDEKKLMNNGAIKSQG